MIYHWREIYSIPLDAINRSPHLSCVLQSNSDTEHKLGPETSELEARECNAFKMKKLKMTHMTHKL